ncbi:MAG: SRPBCC family protein [Bacteroidetes bacterium]|nr:SRPBCC family protein [Bacteroidota bacterium]
MATIHNEITIEAPITKIWDTLTTVDLLDQYDPTVKKSTALTSAKNGMGAKRKVDMLDGKNWFEESVTEFKPNEALTYELTARSFPVQRLKHSYSFEVIDNKVKVKQVMDYSVKFGLLGKLLDAIMIRKQSDIGIKKFMAGLKSFVEKSNSN